MSVPVCYDNSNLFQCFQTLVGCLIQRVLCKVYQLKILMIFQRFIVNACNEIFFAMISVMLSILRRTVGKTTKELIEIFTDRSLKQWMSSFGREEILLSDRSRVLRFWKQKPNFGGILVMKFSDKLQSKI